MKIKVALVDDHENTMLGWEDSLNRYRPNMEVVFKSSSLIKTISFFDKNYLDLLILDLFLPPNHSLDDTVEFVKYAKRKQPRCKIMLITSVATKSALRKVLTVGGDYAHVKGTTKAFIEGVDNTLGGKKTVSLDTPTPMGITALNAIEKRIIRNANKSNPEIGELIGGKSVKTVERYLTVIYDKLDLQPRNKKHLSAFFIDNQHFF